MLLIKKVFKIKKFNVINSTIIMVWLINFVMFATLSLQHKSMLLLVQGIVVLGALIGLSRLLSSRM